MKKLALKLAVLVSLSLDPKSITLNRLGFPSGRFSDSSYWLGLEASMDEALFE